MRIGKILIIVGIAAVVLVVGAAVVLMSMDFNQYKPQIAAEVKKATGRDMTIAGDLRLNLLTLNPGLAVDGVRFANAPWGSRPDMAVIKRFEVKVSIMPLLSGTLDVERVVIEGADILIERNRDGRGNYEFTTAEKPAEPAKPEDASKGEGGSMPSLAVREITIKDSSLTYKDAKSSQTLVLGVQSLAVAAAPGDPLKIDLKGTYNAEPFTVKGTMGELAELMKPSKPWPVKIAAEAGGATVDVNGSIANPAAASGIDLAIAVEGEDLSLMSKIAGAPVPPLGPYSLKTRAVGSMDKVIELRDLAAQMGKSALAGKAALQVKDRPVLSATLTSDLIDLADFTKGGEGGTDGGSGSGAQAPSGATPGAAPAGDGGKRLFPDDPLPVDGLKAADANIDLTVKKLLANKIAVENFHTVVALRNGDLTVTPIDADVAKGKISGMIQLKASQATPTLDLKISGKKIDMGQVLTDMSITDLLEGVINTDLDVAGRGKSVRQIMAGLNGKTNVVMGNGRMKSSAIDTYVGGAASVLTQVIAGKKSEYTVINCFVSQFDIQNGLATSKALLFDTEYAQITGQGTINLATEQLKLTVDPKPKSATINTAVPVEIGGTLAEPTYRLNPLAAAAKVGGLVGAVVFPPAAVIGLGELGVSDKNPCMKPGGGQQQTAPSGPAGAVENVGKDVKDKIEKGLKGIFGK